MMSYKSNNLICNIVLFMCSFLYVSSCGLPSFEVVNSPVVNDPDDNNALKTFLAPSDDSNVDGYEVYYKIYEDGDTSINSDKIELDPNDSNYVYEFGSTKLDNLDFNRLYTGNLLTENIPPIPLISNTNLLATQTFLVSIGAGSDRVTLNGVDLSIIPLRIVKDGNNFKNFSSNVIVTDADRNGVIASKNYSVSFAVYSYVSSLVTTYQSSPPVYMGTITGMNN